MKVLIQLRVMPFFDRTLKEEDPTIHKLIKSEANRQKKGLQLIASENYTSKAVMQTLGSCLTNKYSEGYPGNRYYGGNTYIDEIEIICQNRALECFNLNKDEWDVNVQALSGTPANFAVFTGLLKPHDRIMGLELSHGGHLSHGFYTPKKNVSSTSIYFESLPYQVDENTGFIDYENLEKNAQIFKPKLIIAGASSYSRNFDYKRMKIIADSCGAYLMADIAHISGLIAANLIESPFAWCDIVTTTTHKSLRGPRGALIFYKKQFKTKIDSAVFPGIQGGPHNNNIAGIAVCLKQAKTNEFITYQTQVLKNSKALANSMKRLGYKLSSDGTDNHLIVIDLRPQEVNGTLVEKVLDAIYITVNKNSIINDTNAKYPNGIRIGTYAMTTRGFIEEDFMYIAQLIDRCIKISKDVKNKNIIIENHPDIINLRKDVLQISSFFQCPSLEMDFA